MPRPSLCTWHNSLCVSNIDRSTFRILIMGWLWWEDLDRQARKIWCFIAEIRPIIAQNPSQNLIRSQNSRMIIMDQANIIALQIRICRIISLWQLMRLKVALIRDRAPSSCSKAPQTHPLINWLRTPKDLWIRSALSKRQLIDKTNRKHHRKR